ncbi:MAG: hypothetical protein JXA73_03180 [Acidobacteria bacterium]|nr:hypothetical protein [Acidobacteriota bacterium]
MESSIGWVDFSSEHRNRVKTVLDLLSAPGVLDELGIGVIRDAFSDHLFPGISTIQTRAKYFIIVPRILRNYEQLPDKQRRGVSMEDYLAEQEKLVRIRLVEKYGKKEQLGITGVTFGTRSDRDVLRQPSSIYWNGLRTFGILKTHLSLAEFCRKYSGHRPPLRMVLEETREERGDDIDADDIARSPIATLPLEDDWKNRLTITLSKPEAEFLRHQMTAAKPGSLLGQILMNDRGMDEFLSLQQYAPFEEFADLPFVAQLPFQLRMVVRWAKLFWIILFGAHIRYNCLLQDRFGEPLKKKELVSKWLEWRDQMKSFPWKEWDTAALWELVADNRSNLRLSTRRFIDNWIEEAKRFPSDASGFDRLVIRQEKDNKGKRARLRKDNRDEQIENWVGINALDYRLSQARRILDDIHRAETGKAVASAGF